MRHADHILAGAEVSGFPVVWQPMTGQPPPQAPNTDGLTSASAGAAESAEADALARRLAADAKRLIEAAAAEGAPLRMMGGIAIRSRCPGQEEVLRRFARAYGDVDLVGYARHADAIRKVLAGFGYVETAHVFVDSSGTRMLAHYPSLPTHVDVFLDQLDFCHTISLKNRLEVDSVTLPLAELLLQKLQIVEINRKDLVDIAALLLEHPLADDDRNGVNADRIAALTCADWGLWRTTTMNLAKAAEFAQAAGELSPAARQAVVARAGELRAEIDRHPKSLSWKMRSRIGDRVKWYTDVEEMYPEPSTVKDLPGEMRFP